jgi:hypothetical protein
MPASLLIGQALDRGRRFRLRTRRPLFFNGLNDSGERLPSCSQSYERLMLAAPVDSLRDRPIDVIGCHLRLRGSAGRRVATTLADITELRDRIPVITRAAQNGRGFRHSASPVKQCPASAAHMVNRRATQTVALPYIGCDQFTLACAAHLEIPNGAFTPAARHAQLLDAHLRDVHSPVSRLVVLAARRLLPDRR